MADPANDPLWCRKVRSAEPRGEGRWTLVHKPVPLRPAVELAVEVREAEPPSRLRLREQDEASAFDVEYTLVPTGSGTTFTQISDFEFTTLPRVLHRVFAAGVRRDVRGQLGALKRLVET